MNLQVFNGEFGAIRVLRDEAGEPWFVLNEVAKILGIKNITDLKKRLNPKGLGQTELLTKGGKQKAYIINEPNLFRTILRSDKPEAKRFEDWLVEEVLPAIRKHGGYLTPEKVEEVLLNPDTIIQLATKLKEEQQRRKQLENEVIELKPKAFFADVVSNAEDAILVRDFAKLISKGNFSIGEKRLFKWLRENGYLMQNNKPYQRYIDMGIFKVIERSRTDDKGTRIFHTTKITGKGQIYLQRKIYEDFGVKV